MHGLRVIGHVRGMSFVNEVYILLEHKNSAKQRKGVPLSATEQRKKEMKERAGQLFSCVMIKLSLVFASLPQQISSVLFHPGLC